MSKSAISARWDVSGDPCPVLKYEWAIERIDGERVQEFYDTNGQYWSTIVLDMFKTCFTDLLPCRVPVLSL